MRTGCTIAGRTQYARWRVALIGLRGGALGTSCHAPVGYMETTMDDMKREWVFIAKGLGMPVEEYARHRNAGELWCTGCRDWHRGSEFKVSSLTTTGRRGCCTAGAVIARARWREFDRLEQLSADADAKWRGSPQRVREMVEHFMSTGAKPGRGMVAM